MSYIDFLTTYAHVISLASLITLQVYIISVVIGSVLAILVALARLSPVWLLRAVAQVFVELIRGTPMLIQLFALFYVLPLFGLYLDKYVTAVICLAANLAAYGSEAVKGAIKSVPRGQYEVAIALNMSPMIRMRRIILPQATLLLCPTWGNLLVEYLKYTALVSLIAIPDLMFQMRLINNDTQMSAASFGTALIIYYLIARLLIVPSFRLLERSWEKRMGVN